MPIRAKYCRKDGSRTEEEVVDYAVQMWRDKFGDKDLPDYFVNAQTLSPSDHVKMQAAAQKWIDSSISKTINCPEDISFDAFKRCLYAGLGSGLQRLHDLSPERCDRVGADRF